MSATSNPNGVNFMPQAQAGQYLNGLANTTWTGASYIPAYWQTTTTTVSSAPTPAKVERQRVVTAEGLYDGVTGLLHLIKTLRAGG